MTTETLPVNRESLLEKLQFINAANVADLREKQWDKVRGGEWERPRLSEADYGTYSAAENKRLEESTKPQVSAMYSDFINKHLPEGDDETKARCWELIHEFSIYQMSNEYWLATARPGGASPKEQLVHHDMLDSRVQQLAQIEQSVPVDAISTASLASETSKSSPRYRVTQKVRSLLTRNRAKTPAAIYEPSVDVRSVAVPANSELQLARDAFAAISIEYRRYLRDKRKKNEELRHEYERVAEAYQMAHFNSSQVDIENLLAANESPERIAEYIQADIMMEEAALHRSEAAVLNNDQSLQGRFARWAHTNSGFYGRTAAASFGVGFIASGAVKLIRKAAGYGMGAGYGVLLGATGGLATGAGIAAGTTRAAIRTLAGNRKRQFSEHDKRFLQDQQEVANTLDRESLLAERPVDSLKIAVQGLHAVHQERINKDIRANQIRLGTAMAAGAMSGAVGGLVATEFIRVLDIDKFHGLHLGKWWPIKDIDWNIRGDRPRFPHFSMPNREEGLPEVPKPKDLDIEPPKQYGPPQPEIPEVPEGNQVPEPRMHHHTGHDKIVDGMKVRALSFNGDSITQELQEAAAQKGYDLNPAASYAAYEYLEDHHTGSLVNMFQDANGQGIGYKMANGDIGIRPQQGPIYWNAHDLHDFNTFLAHHPELQETAEAVS